MPDLRIFLGIGSGWGAVGSYVAFTGVFVLCSGILLYLRHLRVRAADLAVDIHRRLHLHCVGHMAVDIKGSEHQKSSHLMGRL